VESKVYTELLDLERVWKASGLRMAGAAIGSNG
jgi:hypothetical protein